MHPDSRYSVGNGQFGLEGSEFRRLLGGSRHPFEQGCVQPAPSLKSGDDWMIDVFFGWYFEVENSQTMWNSQSCMVDLYTFERTKDNFRIPTSWTATGGLTRDARVMSKRDIAGAIWASHTMPTIRVTRSWAAWRREMLALLINLYCAKSLGILQIRSNPFDRSWDMWTRAVGFCCNQDDKHSLKDRMWVGPHEAHTATLLGIHEMKVTYSLQGKTTNLKLRVVCYCILKTRQHYMALWQLINMEARL